MGIPGSKTAQRRLTAQDLCVRNAANPEMADTITMMIPYGFRIDPHCDALFDHARKRFHAASIRLKETNLKPLNEFLILADGQLIAYGPISPDQDADEVVRNCAYAAEFLAEQGLMRGRFTFGFRAPEMSGEESARFQQIGTASGFALPPRVPA